MLIPCLYKLLVQLLEKRILRVVHRQFILLQTRVLTSPIVSYMLLIVYILLITIILDILFQIFCQEKFLQGFPFVSFYPFLLWFPAYRSSFYPMAKA